MKFYPTKLSGAYLIETEPRGDERGYFERMFCAREFGAQNLATLFVQQNHSLSVQRGTLRGMHYQLEPNQEDKLVTCIRGALFDVIIDMRPNSQTRRSWFGAELTEENRLMMYVPRGFAHGFITLADNTQAYYLASGYYHGPSERGVRYDDPAIGIEWPLGPTEISTKDAAWPLLDSIDSE
jgi:dTDP-4-dehydrorhamnose 3,5-epimerase